MNKITTNAVAPQGGGTAHQGRTGVECNNCSAYKILLYGGIGLTAAIVTYKILEHFYPSRKSTKKHKKESKEVDEEFQQKPDIPKSVIPAAEVKVDIEDVAEEEKNVDLIKDPATEDVKTGIPIEERIRQLRAEGKAYPEIAHELHVSIRVISLALKS